MQTPVVFNITRKGVNITEGMLSLLATNESTVQGNSTCVAPSPRYCNPRFHQDSPELYVGTVTDSARKGVETMKRWIFFGLLSMAGCRPQPLGLETYHLQIKDVHLRIPAKYLSSYRNGIKLYPDRDCRKVMEECAQHPPGISVRGIVLFERDFNTFEQYKAPSTGLSDQLTIDLDDPDQVRKAHKLPNSAEAWNPSNRDAQNDIFGLHAYKKIVRDDINYRFDFENGKVLFMTCKAFNMPNPGCSASTSWRGLTLRYVFRHRHLSEWRDLHQRITNHFDSFVYQPK